MKFILNIDGSNAGGKFLENYVGQEVHLDSLYKDIDINSPPLAILKTVDGKQHSVQLIDIRFINEFIFINCFVIQHDDKHGGKALLRLKPVCDLEKVINP
jgi:hypothetical protein|tara:strand:- start:731 stop:1030 length:300 start_codon:yes stop_codon:yes gene_type:complete